MATVHFIQQGKGGVGKSMIAAILYQVLRLLGKQVAAFDTAPVNTTLAGFKEFEVTCLDILKNGDIDPRQFDTLIDAIMEQGPETHVIVDNGASSFLALNSYIKENNIIGILEEAGQFHAIITIPQGNKATIGKDLETLFAKRQSFETAINSGQSIVVRSRLQRYRNELVEAVNNTAIA